MSKNGIFRARVDAEKGTPEKIAQSKTSCTAPFLREIL
jgi:excinuclease UvrABC ATPase subunit